MTTLTATATAAKITPQRTDFEAVRRAQKAMRAAERGEKVEQVEQVGQVGQVASVAVTPRAPAKRTAAPLNETGRETALFRAVSLLSTMTEYYGITVGELEDEKVRLKLMSDEKLMGTIAAYEYASKHVNVMLSDEKAREAAIAKDPKTADFYKENGVGEDELNESVRKTKAKNSTKRIQYG